MISDGQGNYYKKVKGPTKLYQGCCFLDSHYKCIKPPGMSTCHDLIFKAVDPLYGDLILVKEMEDKNGSI